MTTLIILALAWPLASVAQALSLQELRAAQLNVL